MPERRVAVCPNCGHIEDFIMQSLLLSVIDCPNCFRQKTFGPDVFMKGYKGETRKMGFAMANKIRRSLRI